MESKAEHSPISLYFVHDVRHVKNLVPTLQLNVPFVALERLWTGHEHELMNSNPVIRFTACFVVSGFSQVCFQTPRSFCEAVNEHLLYYMTVILLICILLVPKAIFVILKIAVILIFHQWTKQSNTRDYMKTEIVGLQTCFSFLTFLGESFFFFSPLFAKDDYYLQQSFNHIIQLQTTQN